MNADGPHIDAEGCGGNAAPYVLGALTDEEHEAFLVHIESCAVCREEVAALQIVAQALPVAAPQLSAPPELKRRVMSSVREDAHRRHAERVASSRTSSSEGEGERRAPAWSAGGSRASAGAGAWLRWRPNLAVGALAACVIALAVVVLASGGGGGTRVIRAQVTLPRASASLSVSDGQAQLNVAGMPQAGAGRVYEVWTKSSPSGQPRPTDALFTVSAGGAATVGVPGSARGVREVLVTSEPLGGSRVPTRAPVIVARVS